MYVDSLPVCIVTGVQQVQVLLEVEKLASIGYANNIQKEAMNSGFFFFLNYFFINVLIIFPAILLIPLLLVSLNNSFISGVIELSFEYDSRALLIICDTNPAPWPWFNCSSALFKISPIKDGTSLLPINTIN